MEIEKKRFLVFGIDSYYPVGGMNDYVLSFDTLEELLKLIQEDKDVEYLWDKKFRNDRYQIFDTKYYKVSECLDSPTRAFSNLQEK